MKHVEQMRARILRCQQQAIMGIRSYASMLDGNQDVVEMLKGDKGMQLLADVTDFILERLGHKVKTPSKSPNSKTRRAAKKQTRKVKGNSLVQKARRVVKKVASG